MSAERLIVSMDKNKNTLLRIMSSVLFNYDLPHLNEIDWKALYHEAKMQAVFLQVFNKILPCLPKSEISSWEKAAMRVYAQNLEITREHGRLHKVMTSHGIPYITIKGLASAKYYVEPLDRMLGDVDFIVAQDRIEEAYRLVLGLGYKIPESDMIDLSKDLEFHGSQGAHKVVWELHPEVSSLPSGEVGETVREYLSDLIETGKEYIVGKEKCIIPDEKHHCLILLVHMAGHLINEGVGLRHLCDWAAFLNRITDEDFNSEFVEMLQTCGLYRFAQIVTLVCEKYLGMPKRSWSGEAEETLLEDLLNDILVGGNFGFKDRSRYQHAKYIGSVGDDAAEQRKPLQQVFYSIHKKAKRTHPLLMRYFLTYPLGWGVVALEYSLLLLTGRRGRHNPVSVIKEAGRRKDIYKELRIYKTYGTK